jgi:hypothetical protein
MRALSRPGNFFRGNEALRLVIGTRFGENIAARRKELVSWLPVYPLREDCLLLVVVREIDPGHDVFLLQTPHELAAAA